MARNIKPSWWPEWAFALAVAMLLAACAAAEPIAEATARNGVRVTLYEEPCALAAVVNLPRRATWTQNGQVIEGCYGDSNGIIACYFADRTVVLIPSRFFIPLPKI